MELKINDIFDAKKGHKCFTMGCGGSLNKQIQYLEEIKKKGIVLLGCGEWYLSHNICPDYWVVANNVQTIERDIKIFNYYNSTILYADSVDKTDKEFIYKNLKRNFIAYDERNFNSLDKSKMTIQEKLQEYTGYNKRYLGGYTVALHMLAFSIILGCNPIYISGIDLDYRTGYAGYCRTKVKLDEFDDVVVRLNNDFQIIKESAEHIGTKIYNIGSAHKLSVFETKENIEF